MRDRQPIAAVAYRRFFQKRSSPRSVLVKISFPQDGDNVRPKMYRPWKDVNRGPVEGKRAWSKIFLHICCIL